MNKAGLLKQLTLRGISCSDQQLDRLMHFMKTVIFTNDSFNLTAITNESEFLDKMVLDSALALVGNDFSGKKVIDVGTGAGFPGMVLYMLNPAMDLTFLDSTQKKINFLLAYAQQKDYYYNGVTIRAEDYCKLHREEYDVATARAVATLNVLLEIIMPLLKVGGTFIALKGPNVDNEIEDCQKAFVKLGCHIDKIYKDTLPDCGENRRVVYIVKDKPTNKKYPREYNEIKRLPL